MEEWYEMHNNKKVHIYVSSKQLAHSRQNISASGNEGYWAMKAYFQTSNIKQHLSRQWNCWSLRCSWNIGCQRCSNYIFILDLTNDFNGLGRDNCKMRRETFKCCDLVRLILEVWQHIWEQIDGLVQDCSISIANALKILQSCTKPSRCEKMIKWWTVSA